MDSLGRNWHKAHINIVDAEFSLKFATDLTACILKNDKTPKARNIHTAHRGPQETIPHELDMVNINHHRDERMGMVNAFVEKYHALEAQIAMYDKAKNELITEIEAEREYFNNLYKIRCKFPIQDASLLPEFQSKSQELRRILPGRKTLYCHVIQKPDLYIPKSRKNYLNKVLLVRGKSGELEYRCHPDLRKSLKLSTEITFKVDGFHEQTQTFTRYLNGNNTDMSYKNAQFIPNVINKLKMFSLYNCLEKELNGIEYYSNKPDKHGEVTVTQPEQKKFKEYHTKFTRDQYEFIKDIKGHWGQPYEGRKVVELKIDLSYDMHITLKFFIDLYEFDEFQESDYSEEQITTQTAEEPVVKLATWMQMLDCCICRDNIDDIVSLDLMSFLSQRYISYLLNKLISMELGLGYELHYSEAFYFKYHINQFLANKGMDNKLVKRTTVIILEVEGFKLLINIKTKSNNDSEYVGTFTTKEVKNFTTDFAEALAVSLL